MKPAHDIYYRIKWDEGLNKSDFKIGYLDRFDGIIEVPFSSFDTENIPFHRVRIYKQGGVIVWDRENRIDKLTTSDEKEKK